MKIRSKFGMSKMCASQLIFFLKASNEGGFYLYYYQTAVADSNIQYPSFDLFSGLRISRFTYINILGCRSAFNFKTI